VRPRLFIAQVIAQMGALLCDPIPASFFAMTTLKSTGFPKATIGTIGHPCRVGCHADVPKSRHDCRLNRQECPRHS
jgi:hypothetical protein